MKVITETHVHEYIDNGIKVKVKILFPTTEPLKNTEEEEQTFQPQFEVVVLSMFVCKGCYEIKYYPTIYSDIFSQRVKKDNKKKKNEEDKKEEEEKRKKGSLDLIMDLVEEVMEKRIDLMRQKRPNIKNINKLAARCSRTIDLNAESIKFNRGRPSDFKFKVLHE